MSERSCEWKILSRQSAGISGLMVLAAANFLGTARAQEAAQDTGTTIQEIVVTAQRRSERLQDVPVAVSAVSADKLQSAGVQGIADISAVVPSLNVANGNGYLITHLRGIGTIANGPGIENPVALYVDGVYYANQTVGLFSFNNISQIEVLKGPQGTLFGRNATGGLIQVTTAEPTQDLHFKASVGASNYRGTDDSLYVGGGLTPGLAADLAVQYSRRDGWGRNEFNGKDVYAVPRDLALRSKWVYSPGELKLTLIGDYSNLASSNNALATPAGSFAIRGVTPPAAYAQPWDVDTNAQPAMTQVNYGGSLKAEYALEPVSVSNIAAYRRSMLQNLFDYDATALPLTAVHISQPDVQFSDELQLTSRSQGPLQWVAGAYYFRASSQIDPNTIYLASDAALNPFFPVSDLYVYGHTRTDSISGYGQATYNITDRLAFTGGIRYSSERRDYDGSESARLLLPGNPVTTLLPTIVKSETFADPTYRAALAYKFQDDILLYVSWNTGFKSGGFNTTAPTDPGFKPEKLRAVEIGEKADLLDRTLRINSAAFYYDYKDIQTQIPEATGSGIINGAKAHVYGLDTDVTLIPLRNLELTAGLALLHARYLSFPGAPFGTPGGGVSVVSGDASGNTLPYSSRATVDVGATYTVDFSTGNVAFNAQYQHNSGFYFEPDNVAYQPAFQTFNASVRWRTADNHYSVLLYGNNLANKVIYSAIITAPAGTQLATLDAPRTYGVRLSYDY